MTTTKDSMLNYTKDEWNKLNYFISVVERLKDYRIKSMVDLGSCYGEVCNILIKKRPTLEKIIAIEAMKINYDFLLENLKSNTVDITYVNRAVYYGKNFVEMGTTHSNLGGFGVATESSIYNKENVHENIKTITLEDIIGDNVIDFLKMDIEGAEKNVIPNSTSLANIKFLELEMHDALALPENHLPLLEKYLPDHKILLTSYRGDGGNNIFLEKL